MREKEKGKIANISFVGASPRAIARVTGGRRDAIQIYLKIPAMKGVKIPSRP